MENMSILEKLVASNITGADFQNVGLAFLTVLIPLGVAVLSDYFNKLNADKEYSVLDLHVILDGILKFKYLLCSIGLVFVPVLIWDHVSLEMRYVILSVFVIGTIHIVCVLVEFYRWIKGDKDGMRFDYYKELGLNKDLVASSRSIWKSVGMSPYQEKKFFENMMDKIKKSLNYE